MTKEEIIVLGTKLGLTRGVTYHEISKDDRVIFTGLGFQRFIVLTKWDDDKIYQTLGESLILLGEMKKINEIKHTLNIVDEL